MEVKKVKFGLVVLVLSFFVVSCSDNDNGSVDNKMPLVGEIKTIFEATDTEGGVTLYLQSEKDVSIDWGDGQTQTISASEKGAINHEYDDKGEYVITLKTEGVLTQFGNSSLTDISSYKPIKTNPIKNISFGEDVKIDLLNIQTSSISSIFISEKATIYYANILLDKQWDLTFLNNIEKHSYKVLPIEALDVRDLSGVNYLDIEMQNGTEIKNLNITSCPHLKKLDIYGISSISDEFRSVVDNITLDNLPALEMCQIYYLETNVLDLSKTSAEMELRLEQINVIEPIKFDNKIMRISS